jgi:hypothetical protein
VVGLAGPELLEEDPRHRVVVVLAGVDEHVLELVGAGGERAHDRDRLHDVRPRPDDREDLASRAHRRRR